MRALIVGGTSEADFVIKAFKKQKFSFVVVNGSQETAEALGSENNIPVYFSETNKKFTYLDLDIDQYDLVVALENDDIKNFVICYMLKKLFGVKKAICTVRDPDNVAIFKQLGIDSPLSASFLLTQKIVNESEVESLIKTLTIENDRIAITEIAIKKNYQVANQKIRDLHFPFSANISCIYRVPNVIVPKGDTEIFPGDTLIVVSSSDVQKEIVDFIRKDKGTIRK